MVIFKGFLENRVKVLKLLKKNPSNKHIVCSKTTMTYATILTIFKELVSSKMIERINLEIDTRQHKFQLTEKGLQFLELLN